MKTKFSFLDPSAIVGVMVALIILAVGVFAFFTTIKSIPTTGGDYAQFTAVNNTSATGSQIFNIVGVVLIIGAIMSIVGLVYNYVR